ncbi:MAG: hypothetical protein ACREAE_06845, partial [Nitrosopumilaceae archaeon]
MAQSETKTDDALFIAALFNIEIDDGSSVNLELLPFLRGMYITNDQEIVKGLISDRLAAVIGTLEVDALTKSKAVIYGFYPPSFYSKG